MLFDPKLYVTQILLPLLDHPEELDIRVTESEGGLAVIIEVWVHKTDYGKVIGRAGRTYWAVADLLDRVRGKQNSYDSLRNPRVKYLLRVGGYAPRSRGSR